MKLTTLVLLVFAVCCGLVATYLTATIRGTAPPSADRAEFLPKGPAPAAPVAAQNEAVARADKPGAPLAGGDGPAPPAATPVKRQIIYNATVAVVVADFEARQRELTGLVKLHNAFVAKSDVYGNSGTQRSGQWKIRVPVEQFDNFLAAVVGLGIPEKNTVDSQDVTDEFYDLKARIDNKKTLEQRFIVLLQQATGRYEEVIRLENELARVRGEIERMEGSLRRLADLSSLSTVNLTLREEQNYVPPQTPGFGGQVSATFGQSFQLLLNVGRFLVLTAVALGPWLPFPLAALVAFHFWRKRTDRALSSVVTTSGEEPQPR